MIIKYLFTLLFCTSHNCDLDCTTTNFEPFECVGSSGGGGGSFRAVPPPPGDNVVMMNMYPESEDCSIPPVITTFVTLDKCYNNNNSSYMIKENYN